MDYDMIQIQIEAEAKKADSTIDILVSKLDKLSASLTSIGKYSIGDFSSGMDSLAKSVSVLNNIHFDNKSVQDFSNAIYRLSKANLSTLENADFTNFGNSIRALALSLDNTPHINRSFISMTSAISNLSKSGGNIALVTANLQALGYSMRSFFAIMSGAELISAQTISFAQAIGTLANAGAKTATTANNLVALGNSLKQLIVTLSDAPQVNQNIIQMTNALANLASQGGKVGTASKSMVNGLNKTRTAVKQTKTSVTGLASAFGRFYASFFLVIRAVKKLRDAIGLTSEYIESFNYFTVAFEKVASDWKYDFEKYGKENAQAYADSFIERINQTLGKLSGINVNVSADGEGLLTATNVKNLGLNIQEVTQYASQLASITNAVGQTGETTLAVSDAFTKLAGDISSLFNVDYSQVSNNLQSALIGMSRSVYKYGIDITNATLQTLAYELGIEKAVSEMTQMEKQQLRVISILRQSKVSWGDLANTINSPSNMIRQLSTNLKEVSMVLGQLFIPLLTKVLPIINGLAIALKNVLVDFANLAGIKINFSEFGQGYNEAEEGLSGIEEGIDGVNGSLKKANKSLRSFDELLTIGTENQNISETQDMLDLTEEILKATEEYNAVWNSAFEEMENKAQEFADKIYSTFTSNDWSSVGEKLGEGLVTFINNVDDWIKKIDWQKLGEQITTAIDGIDTTEIVISVGKLLFDVAKATIGIEWGSLKKTYEQYGLPGIFATWLGFGAGPGTGILYRVALKLGFDISEETGIGNWFEKNIKEPIISKAEEIGSFFTELGNKIRIPLKNALVKIRTYFTGAKDKITTAWSTLSEWFEKNVSSPISNLFTGIKKNIENVFNGEEGISKTLKDFFEWTNTNIITPISNGFANIGESISGAFEDAWTDIKETWGGVVSWFDENIVTPISDAFVDVKEAVSGAFEDAKTLIETAWDTSTGWIDEKIITPITTAFSTIGESISGAFEDAWEDVKTAWENASTWFTENISTPVKNIFQSIANKIKSVFDGIWKTITRGLSSAINSIITFFENGINNIVDGLNKVIEGYNSVAKFFDKDYSGVELVAHIELPKVSLPSGNSTNYNPLITNQIHQDMLKKGNNNAYGTNLATEIEKATYNGTKKALEESNANPSEQKTVIEIDGNEVFNVVKKRNNERFNATGVSPLLY